MGLIAIYVFILMALNGADYFPANVGVFAGLFTGGFNQEQNVSEAGVNFVKVEQDAPIENMQTAQFTDTARQGICVVVKFV